jgi:hypothetical protein
MSERSGVLYRSEGIRGFARLRDRDDERSPTGYRFPVAVFARGFDIASYTGHTLRVSFGSRRKGLQHALVRSDYGTSELARTAVTRGKLL